MGEVAYQKQIVDIDCRLRWVELPTKWIASLYWIYPSLSASAALKQRPLKKMRSGRKEKN
jgi:hypothetical protein